MHHYLPVWYLAGFTPSGRTRDRLWVHDLKAGGRVWPSPPKKVARQRDLYTVSSGPTEPDLFEGELARRDGEHAKLVREVCQSRQFPRGRFDDLLRFVALTYTRSPAMRTPMSRWVEQRTESPFEVAVQDPENWRWLGEWLGLPLPTVHDLVRTYAPGTRTQLWHVLLIDVLLHSMLPLLKSRKWSLCVSQSDYYFVCSSTPLGITWPVGHPSDKRPTLGDEESILTFPLDRHTALVAGIDERCCVKHVGRDAVAEINNQTVLSLRTHAVQGGFVFAPAKEFYCMGNDGLLQVSGAGFTPVSDLGR
jgi:hypothetical protein